MAIDRHPTIQITYNLAAGNQKRYHENPGVAYPAASLIAYLPDSSEGNRLLQRLVYAFQHGLTFQVGTSMANDRSKNCNISWASIPHKTTRQGGGPHSWPDPFYFKICDEELDNLGVPREFNNQTALRDLWATLPW
jgi:Deltex C-terminal domain